MKPEILEQLSINDIREIVMTADFLMAHMIWDAYLTEESYYSAVLNQLKEKAK